MKPDTAGRSRLTCPTFFAATRRQNIAPLPLVIHFPAKFLALQPGTYIAMFAAEDSLAGLLKETQRSEKQLIKNANESEMFSLSPASQAS